MKFSEQLNALVGKRVSITVRHDVDKRDGRIWPRAQNFAAL
jgi:hypothetical protein